MLSNKKITAIIKPEITDETKICLKKYLLKKYLIKFILNFKQIYKICLLCVLTKNK